MKVYSLDNERYYNKENFIKILSDSDEFYIPCGWSEAEKEIIEYKEVVCGSSIIGTIQNTADSNYYFSDSNCLEQVLYNEEKLRKLEDLVSSFLKENVKEATIFNVKNIKEYTNTPEEIIKILTDSRPNEE